jgi:hypothetical protein
LGRRFCRFIEKGRPSIFPISAKVFRAGHPQALFKRVSVNRAIVDLLKDGIEAYEQRRQSFFELADRYRRATDQNEIERLREQLARMTFGS